MTPIQWLREMQQYTLEVTDEQVVVLTLLEISELKARITVLENRHSIDALPIIKNLVKSIELLTPFADKYTKEAKQYLKENI